MGLLIDNKQLMLEWDWTSNNEVGLTPDTLTNGSNKKAWWRCKCGHKWQASVYTRTKGHGCPKCAKKHLGEKMTIPNAGESLQDLFPSIAKEWNYSKNKELPTQVCAKSNRKAWWVCNLCGHEWEAIIANRVRDRGCPACSRSLRTSEPERIVYFYIKQYCDDAIWGYNGDELRGYELDIYIPSYNIGVEYDGQAWHKDTTRDLRKDQICEELNIHIIRIREPDCPIYQSTAEFMYLKDLKPTTLQDTITNILIKLEISNPEVNISKDQTEIDALIVCKYVKNSLINNFPEVATEWNYQKNGNLLPENVTAHSHKKVWWKCLEFNHEWQSTIANRTKGNGCPECSKRKISLLYSKPVKCVELNRIFISGSDASQQLGITQSRINLNCNGKCEYAGRHPDTNEKLHWEFVEDKEG